MADKIVPFALSNSNDLKELEIGLSLDIKQSIRSQQTNPKHTQLLTDVFELMGLRLEKLLKGLLENADNALFELALKAGNQDGQKLHFDTMRELRFKRKVMTQTYNNVLHNWLTIDRLNHVTSAIDEIKTVYLDDANSPHPALTENSISYAMLLAQSIEDIFQYLNKELLERAHACVPFTGIRDTLPTNPCRPSTVVAAFLAACTHLKLEQPAIDNILILFDRYILRNLFSVYGEANQALKLAGIVSTHDHNVIGLPLNQTTANNRINQDTNKTTHPESANESENTSA